MTITRTGPVDQDYFMSYMQLLGYKIDEDGMCHGYAWMANQAILAGAEQIFMERCQFLHEYWQNKKDILDDLENVTQKSRLILEKLKKTSLKNQEKWTQYYRLIDEEFSPDEKILFEIKAFFDGIAAYSEPFLYPDLALENVALENESISLKNPLLTFNLFQPQDFMHARKEGKEIISFSGLYDHNELKIYFSTLRSKIKEKFKDLIPTTNFPPISLVCGSTDHTATLGYDLNKDSWIIFDGNFLTKTRIEDDDAITNLVIDSFWNEKAVNIYTQIYSLKQYSDDLTVACKEWLEEQKEIHQVTNEKAQYELGETTWLFLAVRNNEEDTVNKLLEEGANPNLHDPIDNLTPLYVAVQQTNINIVTKLIAYGADVNAECSSNQVTPLFAAVSVGHADLVKLLLENGADPNVTINGISALNLAENDGLYVIADLLRKYSQPLEESISEFPLFGNLEDETLMEEKKTPSPIAWNFYRVEKAETLEKKHRKKFEEEQEEHDTQEPLQKKTKPS